MAYQEIMNIEKFSRAVSLTVLEIDIDRNNLIPAYYLANLMSPSLWAWREKRSAYDPSGRILGVKRRCREIERHFHSNYSFTYMPEYPGGDPWGLLYFPDEEKRLGKDFIDAVRKEYDESLRMLLRQNPESQFGRIVNEQYYKEGYFPRLRNEIIEVMDAYKLISPDGKGSGKCLALAMLWITSLVIWARFSPDKVVLIGNRAHAFGFLLEEEGILFNNTKQFTYNRIHNLSELSEFVRMVTTSTDTTFFFIPSFGMCHCFWKKSDIPYPKLQEVYEKIKEFLGIPLKHPDLNLIKISPVAQPPVPIPNPLEFNTPEEYQAVIFSLARKFPGSIYDFVQYAFRKIDVPYPQAYIYAALRDYHVSQHSRRIKSLQDALNILESIEKKDSIFNSRDRIALPDEVLIFKTGNDRDRALLLYTLLYRSQISDPKMAIGFSEDKSYVYYNNKWIDVMDFSTHLEKPKELKMVFNIKSSENVGII